MSHASPSTLIADGLLAAGDVAYRWELASDRLVLAGAAGPVLGRDWPDLDSGAALAARIAPEDLAGRLQALSLHYAEGSPYDCEYRLTRRDGGWRWVHDRGRAIYRDGVPVELRGVLRPIDRRKAYEAELHYLANHDELTGLCNRQRLRDALAATLTQCRRYDEHATYVVLGIDKLSVINEGFGYGAADEVIAGVGHRLERLLRASDTVGRNSGDQFGLILTRCGEADATPIVERILDNFRDEAILTPSGAFRITVSAGIVAVPGCASSAHDIMARAEHALMRAKTRGRDCWMRYEWSEEQQQQHRTHLAMGDKVLGALKNGRCLFAFQPVMHAGGTVAFYEALLRLREPDGCVISAGHFIPAIERLGLIRVVDLFVLEMAVNELLAAPDLRLAVNVSAVTLSDRTWLRRLVGLLRQRPQVAQRLILEVTETAAISDFDESVAFVRMARELGCKVALDDFGAGHTSFRHLRSLDIDLLKLDGAFVQTLATDPEQRRTVKSLIDLAKSFGLETVAEFVEREQEAEILRADGITYLQGYLFGAPTLDRPWLVANDPVTVPVVAATV